MMQDGGVTQGQLVRWSPSRDVGIALLTEVGMILSYIAIARSGSHFAVMIMFVALVVPVLTVGVPVCWTTLVDRQQMSALGLSLRHWLPALVLGLGLCAIEVGQVIMGGPSRVSIDQWMPQALAGAASIWEPLFVFGWLQLRFEKDFGVLPAVLLASACFALYHVGFGSVNMMMGQFLSAVVYATVFRLVKNLLAVWPFLWAASSARICIASHFCFFNWSSAMFMLLLLVIEIAFIGFMAYRVRIVNWTLDRRRFR
jgi:membrane protease YdiL (CAAX protease family)